VNWPLVHRIGGILTLKLEYSGKLEGENGAQRVPQSYFVSLSQSGRKAPNARSYVTTESVSHAEF
jgi:hypothetical protein